MRYSLVDLPTDETDWARVDAMTDEDIARAVADDPDAAPLMEDDDPFWTNAVVVQNGPPKEAISIRIDQDVLAWFRDHGVGYQTRMNAVLRAFMKGDLIVKPKAKRKARAKKG